MVTSIFHLKQRCYKKSTSRPKKPPEKQPPNF